MIFAVTLKRGGPWNWSCDLRDQQGFEPHASFVNALVEEGFILLGGPLALDREVLYAVKAASEHDVRERLAADPWHQNGMLAISSIRSWLVLLDSLGATGQRPQG